MSLLDSVGELFLISVIVVTGWPLFLKIDLLDRDKKKAGPHLSVHHASWITYFGHVGYLIYSRYLRLCAIIFSCTVEDPRIIQFARKIFPISIDNGATSSLGLTGRVIYDLVLVGCWLAAVTLVSRKQTNDLISRIFPSCHVAVSLFLSYIPLIYFHIAILHWVDIPSPVLYDLTQYKWISLCCGVVVVSLLTLAEGSLSTLLHWAVDPKRIDFSVPRAFILIFLLSPKLTVIHLIVSSAILHVTSFLTPFPWHMVDKSKEKSVDTAPMYLRLQLSSPLERALLLSKIAVEKQGKECETVENRVSWREGDVNDYKAGRLSILSFKGRSDSDNIEFISILNFKILPGQMRLATQCVNRMNAEQTHGRFNVTSDGEIYLVVGFTVPFEQLTVPILELMISRVSLGFMRNTPLLLAALGGMITQNTRVSASPLPQ